MQEIRVSIAETSTIVVNFDFAMGLVGLEMMISNRDGGTTKGQPHCGNR